MEAKGLILEAAAFKGGGAKVLWEVLMCMFMGLLGGEVISLELLLEDVLELEVESCIVWVGLV